jgi:hypothetical protein
LQENVQRIMRDTFKTLADNTFGGAQNQLKNPRNASTALLLDQFHSFRGGWDLNAEPVIGDDGFAKFQLGDTQENRDRWFRQYGVEMPQGQTLIGGNGKEVVLDKLGLDLQQRFNQMTNQLVDEKNTLLQARGLQNIQKQNWYVPPPNTNGKYIGFVFDAANNVVPGMTVVARTPQEYAALKASTQQAMAEQKMGLGYIFRDQQDVKNFADVWQQAQTDMVNPGVTAFQPKKAGKGLLTGVDIVPNAFDESMKNIRNQYLQHGNDIISTVFDDQIKSNQARSAWSQPIQANNPRFGGQQNKNIYDMYNDALLGRSRIDTGSYMGKIANGVEGAIDSALSSVTPGVSGAVQKLSDAWTGLGGMLDNHNPFTPPTAEGNKDFNALVDALGPHMPYDNAAQMIEKQNLGARPWTSAQIGQNLNGFSAAALIRMFEVAQPIVHLAAVVNAMPAVIRSYMPRVGEATEDWLARIGHSGIGLNLERGNVGIADMMKIGVNGFKRAWSPSTVPEWDYLVSQGMVGHEVAEFHKQFGAIDSRGSWERFFLGDNSITNPTSVADKLKQKGVVGWTSILTDKSYDFTRSWSMMSGMDLAEQLGIDGVENKAAFANDFANKMIANYSPRNKPAIFQGALGTPLGLFQGFNQEFYQRMFRYVETKDTAALAHQMVMQGALFGINSVPGFSAYNNIQSWISKQGQDPDFAVRDRLGQNAADFLQHGVLANIPTLFGQDGMSINTRGDAQLRLPGVMTAPPGFQVMKKMAGGITGAANAFWHDNGTLTGEQMGEILGNAIPNRPIAGLIQQFAGQGDEVDSGGQLKSDTKTAMEMVYRSLGLHSTRQEDDINAYYANKAAMQHKASNDSVLRLATRAALRSGNTDALPAIYQNYLENGGDPRQYQKWLKANQQAATSTRGERQLDAALKSVYKDPVKMGQITRLLDSGVTAKQNANLYPNPLPATQTPDPEMNQPLGYPGTYDGQMTSAPQPGSRMMPSSP